MATIVERHVQHDQGDSGMSAVAMVVAVVALALLIGFFLFMTGAFPFSGAARTDDAEINVNFPAAVNPFDNQDAGASQQDTTPNP